MRTRRKLSLVVVCLVLIADPVRVAADDEPKPAPSERLRMRDDSTLTLKSGTRLLLPPGRFIAEPKFTEDEAELMRLQTLETRLTAENKSLRASANGWQPGWKTLTASLITGVIAGLYIRDRLD